MAFSLTLKRTFEEVIDVSCSNPNDLQPDPTMTFRIPVKRQKLQMTPRKLGLEYRELISLDGSTTDNDDEAADVLCLAAARQSQDRDVPRVRLVTTTASSPSCMMTSPPPRTYREVFPKEELGAANAQTSSSFEKHFNARQQQQACSDLQTRLALLGQPVVASACLNLSIPEYQAAAAAAATAAAAALMQQSTSPLRANEVPETLDDRTSGFGGRTPLLPSQLFQHPSLLRQFSVLNPSNNNSLCLWKTEDVAVNNNTASSCRNGFPDPQRLFDGSQMRRIGGHGSVGAIRSRLSDRVGTEAEQLVTSVGGEDETAIGPVEVCAECQKVFKRKVYLQRHMEREHWLPAKVFKCDDCKYETKHQSNLSVHRRTHTGERPYHCGACGQRYTQGHLLKSHIRSRHAGNLRFYNLDKRSDSTRGRKSLDYKHDIYLSLPTKDHHHHLAGGLGSILSGPDSSSIQAAFTYQRERFSSVYMPSCLPNPALTNWSLPARSKLRREWPNGGGYFALVPQRSANNVDPLFLSTGPGGGLPFFSHRALNLSSADLPIFQTDVTQLLSSADRKPALYQTDEYGVGHLLQSANVVRLPRSGSMSLGGDGQPRFGNEALVNVKNDDLEMFCGRTSPPQSYPEDLTVTKRPDVLLLHVDQPTTISPCVDGSVVSPPGNSNVVDVDGDGRSPYLLIHHQSLPTFKDIDEGNSQTNRVESSLETTAEYDTSVKNAPLHHQLLPADDISPVQGREAEEEENRDVRVEHVTTNQPEMTLRGNDDEGPTDLSITGRCPSTDIVKDSNPDRTQPNGTSLTYPDSDDSSNSASSSISTSSTSHLPLERRRLHRRVRPHGQTEAEAEAALDGSICPHFQKLQEFRRIVLRFVNAFAPNSLGGISDKDDSFAETDLIDDIVHAAMFNDVE